MDNKTIRIQNFSLITIIAIVMFTAMTLMDLVRDVNNIKHFITERQEMPNKVKAYARQQINLHIEEDKIWQNRIEQKIDRLIKE